MKNEIDIEKLAKLSALKLTEQEKIDCKKQLEDFIDFAQIIHEYKNEQFETQDIYPCPLREDNPRVFEGSLPQSYYTMLPTAESCVLEEDISKITPFDYKAKIGLEIHAQLMTKSKMFCSCPNVSLSEPNTNICPICLAHPGTLPTVNKNAIKLAIKAGKALKCTIHLDSRFDRKNYFYPDMPKSYQITQYYKPICTDGLLEVLIDGQKKSFRLDNIHLEEDAAKLVHQDASNRHNATKSFIDFNRAGVPLIEIVTKPDFANGQEASEFVRMLRILLINLQICAGNMESGNLRVDANVSVEVNGKSGAKTEIKNLNSFKAISSAIKYESYRQACLLSVGKEVQQQTRLWDEKLGATFAMRSKEECADYRYFPEPDLLPIVLEQSFVDQIKCETKNPVEILEFAMKNYGVDETQARILLFNQDFNSFFEKCVNKCEQNLLNSWFFNELLQYCDNQINENITSDDFVKLINMIDNQEISAPNVKQVIKEAFSKNMTINEILQKSNCTQINDRNEIQKLVEIVLSENKKQVISYKNGETKLYGYLFGQIIKKSNKRANVQITKEILQEYLDK